MYAITISGKRGNEFEGEWGAVCDRVWWEEGEGRNAGNKL